MNKPTQIIRLLLLCLSCNYSYAQPNPDTCQDYVAEFDGVDDFVLMETEELYDLSHYEFALEAIYSSTGNPNSPTQTIMAYQRPGDPFGDQFIWTVTETGAGYATIDLRRDFKPFISTTSSYLINDGECHRLAVNFRPLPGSHMADVYIDGELVETLGGFESLVPIRYEYPSDSELYLGMHLKNYTVDKGDFLKGTLDEVRIWFGGSLGLMYWTPLIGGPLNGDEPELLAYWSFDQDFGNQVITDGIDGVLKQRSLNHGVLGADDAIGTDDPAITCRDCELVPIEYCLGYEAHFDGNTDFIAVEDDGQGRYYDHHGLGMEAIYSSAGSFSSTQQTILSYQSTQPGPDNSYFLWTVTGTHDDYATIDFSFAGGDLVSTSSSYLLNDGECHQLGLIVSGSSSSYSIEVYIDGGLVETISYFNHSATSIFPHPSTKLFMGAQHNNWYNIPNPPNNHNNVDKYISLLNGKLDEVRLWHRTGTSNVNQNNFTEIAGDKTGLLGYWNFDQDFMSQMVHDDSEYYPSPKHGTLGIDDTWSYDDPAIECEACVYPETETCLGYQASFDGIDDFIAVDDNGQGRYYDHHGLGFEAIYSYTGNLGDASQQTILSYQSTTQFGDSYFLWTVTGTQGDKATIDFSFANGGLVSTATDYVLNDGECHQLGLIVDGYSSTYTVDVYINGTLVETIQIYDSSSSLFPHPSAKLFIGTQFNKWYNIPGAPPQHNTTDEYLSFLNAKLDEVRIWNNAEKSRVNQNNFAKLGGNEPGLIGYWNFDQDFMSQIVHDANKNLPPFNGLLGGKASFNSTDPVIECEECLDTWLGIDELKEKMDLLIYPNPAETSIFITGKSGYQLLEVYDMQGRLVHQLENLEPGVEVDLQALKTGVYTIRLSDNEDSINRMLIKK